MQGDTKSFCVVLTCENEVFAILKGDTKGFFPLKGLGGGGSFTISWGQGHNNSLTNFFHFIVSLTVDNDWSLTLLFQTYSFKFISFIPMIH